MKWIHRSNTAQQGHYSNPTNAWQTQTATWFNNSANEKLDSAALDGWHLLNHWSAVHGAARQMTWWWQQIVMENCLNCSQHCLYFAPSCQFQGNWDFRGTQAITELNLPEFRVCVRRLPLVRFILQAQHMQKHANTHTQAVSFGSKAMSGFRAWKIQQIAIILHTFIHHSVYVPRLRELKSCCVQSPMSSRQSLWWL